MCTTALVEALFPAQLILHGQWRLFLWLLMELCVLQSPKVGNEQGLFLAVGILVATCTILAMLLKSPLLELKDHKAISSFIFIPSPKQTKDIFPCSVKKLLRAVSWTAILTSPW